MKTNEFLILESHLERLFGEPFYDFIYHAEDALDRTCDGCDQIWAEFMPDGKHKNTIRIDVEGPKITMWVQDDHDEKAISANLADPTSDDLIKQVLNAALRY